MEEMGGFKLAPLSQPTRPVPIMKTLLGDEASVVAHAQTPARPREENQVCPPKSKSVRPDDQVRKLHITKDKCAPRCYESAPALRQGSDIFRGGWVCATAQPGATPLALTEVAQLKK